MKKIDWERQRKHWIAITGHGMTTDGKKKLVKLKDGREVVSAQAPNTQAVIGAVANKVLSDAWADLCAKEDEPVK